MAICSCGSNLEHKAQFDARGIFLCYTCQKCQSKKLATFKKNVLTNPNYR